MRCCGRGSHVVGDVVGQGTEGRLGHEPRHEGHQAAALDGPVGRRVGPHNALCDGVQPLIIHRSSYLRPVAFQRYAEDIAQFLQCLLLVLGQLPLSPEG